MSHSTTATSTFVLRKYSRSYPTVSASEWQHYVNPTIRLSVDSRNASNGELESVRLRIVWSMDNGEGSSGSQVLFEDLELLSFNPQKQTHGLPLKAVYRDTIVGIRYLHPKEYTGTPTYRRFQMTFASAAVATQFINAIRSACPCKPNGATNDAPPLPFPVPQESQMPQAQTDIHFQPLLESQYAMPPPTWTSERTQTMRPPAPPDPSSMHQHYSQIPNAAISRHDSFSMHPTPLPAHAPSAYLPASGPSNAAIHLPTAPAPEKRTTLDSLTTSQLYKLTSAELTAYAEEIVQEPGFLQLMNNLSSSWRLRQLTSS